MHWVAATAPAANDGILQLYIDGDLVQDVSTADTDTLDVDTIIMGTVLNTISGVSGVFTNDNVRVGTSGFAHVPGLLDDPFDSDANWTLQNGAVITGGELVCASVASSLNRAFYDDATSPTTERWESYLWKIDQGHTMTTANDAFTGGGIYSDASNSLLSVGLINDAGTLKFKVNHRNDSGGVNTSIATSILAPLEDEFMEVVLHWKSATAPAANDGIQVVWINDIPIFSDLAVDSDTLIVTRNFLGVILSTVGSFNITQRFDDFKLGLTGFDPTAIVQATDLSISKNHATQTTEALQPLFDIVNRRANFNGAKLLERVAFTNGTISQPNTIAALGKFNVAGASGGKLYDGTTSTQRHLFQQTGASTWRMHAGVSLDVAGGDTVEHVFMCEFNTTSGQFFIDGGAAEASGNVGTQVLGGISIGGDENGTGTLDGYQKLLQIIDRLLTTPEKDKLGTYNANKGSPFWEPVA